MFFASGTSALVFETLWFRQAGLTLGNGIWASSLVLSGFMAGLGLGNALAARLGDRVRRPLRGYALLELAIGAAGAALVLGLPHLAPWLAPWLDPFLERPALGNAIRFASAFVLLLVPSTAMGATLPLLTRALTGPIAGFGVVLGLLYGCNTLGAVAGPLLTETVLIRTLGIRGSAIAAAFACAAIAVAALALERGVPVANPPAAVRAPAARSGAARWLVSAFSSGFALLALELLWFRVLLLFVPASSFAFALMLSTVLAGIGLGGLAASAWLRRRPEAWRDAATLAIGAAAASAGCYAGFPLVMAPFGTRALSGLGETAAVGAALMLPTAALSGALFTVIGAAVRHRLPGDAATAGMVTLFNTAGAAVGSLAAGFVLLPWLGTQRAILCLALVYVAIGLLLLPVARRWPALAVGAVGVAALGLLGFGRIQERFLDVAAARWSIPGVEVVAAREGLTETILYLQYHRAGLPRHHLMVTNSFAMSGTEWPARRYMKLFVIWPAAVHANLESALLISYGVGSTARALADVESLRRIDVVDVSRDVLELSDVVYPDPAANPLHDPRVHVYVEDGRHFLQVRDRRYDLITGEPPPPHVAGIVNLYTQEYFALMRKRLAEGGIVSYWLPTHSLDPRQSQAILRAFCNVFDDCSLWAGAGHDLMMVGTRGASGPVTEASFSRPWRNPVLAGDLHAIGLERPEMLGATFIGDAAYLEEVTSGVEPLVDDHPERLWKTSVTTGRLPRLYRDWMDVAANRRRFLASPLIERLWPPSLRAATLPYFELQGVINRVTYRLDRARSPLEAADLVLTGFPGSAALFWALDSDVELQRAVEGLTEPSRPDLQLQLGIGAIAAGRFEDALAPLARAAEELELQSRARLLRAYALCRLDRATEAAVEATPFLGGASPGDGGDADSWRWLATKCALRDVR